MIGTVTRPSAGVAGQVGRNGKCVAAHRRSNFAIAIPLWPGQLNSKCSFRNPLISLDRKIAKASQPDIIGSNQARQLRDPSVPPAPVHIGSQVRIQDRGPSLGAYRSRSIHQEDFGSDQPNVGVSSRRTMPSRTLDPASECRRAEGGPLSDARKVWLVSPSQLACAFRCDPTLLAARAVRVRLSCHGSCLALEAGPRRWDEDESVCGH